MPWALLAAVTSKKGLSVLLYTYVAVFFFLAATSFLLSLGALNLQQAQRSVGLNQAFWAAESGMEEAIYELRTTLEPPVLQAGQCADYSLPPYGIVQRTYRLCGTTEEDRYEIEATAAVSGATQRLSAVVDDNSKAVRFDQVVSVDAGIVLMDARTGGVNTLRSLGPDPSIRGDIATRQSAPRGGSTGGAGQAWIELRGTSRIPGSERGAEIQGDIYVGKDSIEEQMPQMVYIDQYSRASGAIKKLSEEAQWPAIKIPENARPLSSVRHRWTSRGGLCLESGRYVVDSLALSGGNELCSVGPVDLYVTEGLVVVGPGAMMYGQPALAKDGQPTRPFAQAFSPKDLRIFNLGRYMAVLAPEGTAPTIIAAAIYAPQTNFYVIGPAVLLGSANVASFSANYCDDKDTTCRSELPPGLLTTSLFYDQVLGGLKLRIGPGEVAMLMWRRGQASQTGQQSQ